MIIRYLDPRGFETILIPNPIDTQKNASKVYFPEKPQPRKKKKKNEPLRYGHRNATKITGAFQLRHRQHNMG